MEDKQPVGEKENKIDPVDMLEKTRDTIISTALQFKKDRLEEKGKLSPNDLNAIANAMRSAGYIEQIRSKAERSLEVPVIENEEQVLSAEDKKRLDNIIDILEGKKPPRKKRPKKKEEPST